MNLIRRFFATRFWSLVKKEFQQILTNKQIIFLLLFPPTIQLLLLGFALNPNVTELSLGVVDYSQTQESRELVSALTENKTFKVSLNTIQEKKLVEQVRTGSLTTGVIIPPDFREKIIENKTTEIQILIDAVDANTGQIARGYIQQIIRNYNHQIDVSSPSPLINTEIRFLYNPGLISSWFFVPGVMGLVLTLTGSLVSSVTVIREKDVGTLEQLLMTPASAWEILFAKITPLFFLLMGDVFLASMIGWVVFSLPFRGNYFLFLLFSAMYIFVVIGLGMLLATLSKTQQQVVLISFFFNVPLIQLSGAVAPIESMPPFFQFLSFADPMRHYIAIARHLILKEASITPLLPNVIALVFFATLLLGISINRFRRQLT
ncbi:ABC-2 type transporter [Halothece sp. PCC 7418]|uniref:ABC transporter permease n=1 Tax=Halothece sp. (strain PCC 7418) TaxID=65093 RepID=UPI0002A07C93|nr:ABC transporter permease [Halothece sp. PCC 7418]AFZ44085.1 ABC-2 type transporter [Halothece sp. PCC 7418]